jgi:transcriptional regulator with XRE-family HTH domain
MKEKENEVIGLRIKEFRSNAGLTQGQLAEKAAIDTNNLSRIERGQTTPMLETILKIASALDVTPNDILLLSYDAPKEHLDAELAKLLQNMSIDKRKKVIEYIQFLNQQPGE